MITAIVRFKLPATIDAAKADDAGNELIGLHETARRARVRWFWGQGCIASRPPGPGQRFSALLSKGAIGGMAVLQPFGCAVAKAARNWVRQRH